MSMHVARLQFGRPRRQHRDAADHAVNGYLAELVKNGQACEYFLTEAQAYRELANPRSKLSTLGRGICSSIGSATEKPTYYYLMRYYGRKSGEGGRRCPIWWPVGREGQGADRLAILPF